MIKRLPLYVLFLIVLSGCTTLPFFSSENQRDENKQSAKTSSYEEGRNFSNEGQTKNITSEHDRVFEDAALGFNGLAEKQYFIFFNPEEMGEYISDDDLMVDIDFTKQMVLACFMGEKKSGGYMNLISRIEEGTESLTVYVELSEPGKGDLVAQMITSPWHAVVTDFSEKRVEWLEVKAEL